MVRVQLLFFDLDDTLLDHRGAEAAAQRETFEANRERFGGVTFEQWLPRYQNANAEAWRAYGEGRIARAELEERRFAGPLAAFGLDTGSAAALGVFYLAAYARHWRLNEGAEEILAAASLLGTVGLLSNGFRELQRAKVARFRLDRWARHVILSDDVGAMKPSKAIFQAAERAALPAGGPARKVYLGDHFETDVVGAKNAGWLPVLYSPAGRQAPEPVLYVRRLVDLKPLLE